jgi:translation initiation factor IF-1
VIEEVLPNALFRVRLGDGRTVRAGLAPALRHQIVRLIGGAKVVVKLSQFDPGRGQIIEKV